MNNIVNPAAFTGYFNEKKFIDAVIAFARMRTSLNAISHNLVYQLPRAAGPWVFPPDYHLTGYCLEHILRRHTASFKLSLPTGKFTIPLPEITDLIMQAYPLPAKPIVKIHAYERVLDTGRIIGRDQNGQECSLVKVIVDSSKWIKTAYPVSNLVLNS